MAEIKIITNPQVQQLVLEIGWNYSQDLNLVLKTFRLYSSGSSESAFDFTVNGFFCPWRVVPVSERCSPRKEDWLGECIKKAVKILF